LLTCRPVFGSPGTSRGLAVKKWAETTFATDVRGRVAAKSIQWSMPCGTKPTPKQSQQITRLASAVGPCSISRAPAFFGHGRTIVSISENGWSHHCL
jgi:hypothetical protein